MTKQSKAAQMKLLRSDARHALAKASPFCNPLSTTEEVAKWLKHYRMLRRLHSIYARHSFVRTEYAGSAIQKAHKLMQA